MLFTVNKACKRTSVFMSNILLLHTYGLFTEVAESEYDIITIQNVCKNLLFTIQCNSSVQCASQVYWDWRFSTFGWELVDVV